jgi:CMP-N,N'-diacetyllegionaminic acid synthase
MAKSGLEVLAIIPARAGSKGVPGKNLKSLGGKALIEWTFIEALKSKLVEKMIVSTDDENVANLALSYGIEVPFLRPAAISGDFATDVQYIKHALQYLEVNQNYVPDIVVRLPPTSPFRTFADIDVGIQHLISLGAAADSVRPIVEVSKHPYKFWEINKIDARYIDPLLSESFTGLKDAVNSPRQLLPKVYMHTGAMDVLWTETAHKYNSTSGPRVGYFFMDEARIINIDTHAEFEYAEFLISRRVSKNTG